MNTTVENKELELSHTLHGIQTGLKEIRKFVDEAHKADHDTKLNLDIKWIPYEHKNCDTCDLVAYLQNELNDLGVFNV